MSSMTRTSLHGVTAISVKYDDKGWIQFDFVDKHGGRHDVVAFVDKPIAIEGAEFLNFVAASPEPA